MKSEVAYIYNLSEVGDLVFTLSQPYRLPHQNFFNEEGELLGFVRGRTLIIYSNYAWNGCSPRKWLDKERGWSIGTPNGPIVDHIVQTISNGPKTVRLPQTGVASLVHDFLCQFRPKGISQKGIDQEFKYLLERAEWRWTPIYYNVVRFYMKYLVKRV